MCHQDDGCCPNTDVDYICMCSWHQGYRLGEEWKLELSIRKKSLLDPDFPHTDVYNEFINYSDPKLLTTKIYIGRPQIYKSIMFLSKHVAWVPAYSFEKLLPLQTKWDMRNLLNDYHNLTEPKLKPEKIVKECVRQGVKCYQVDWDVGYYL